MDNFSEQLVVRNESTGDRTVKICVTLGIVLLVLFIIVIAVALSESFPLVFSIAILLSSGCIYGLYRYITGTYIEYEYAVTNGEMDIDKITGKRKRRRMISLDVSKVEAFGKMSQAGEPGNVTTVLASARNADEDYYADFMHDDYGKVRLIFTPNEKTLNAIYPFLPAAIRKR